jgi:hypothetical protein
MLRITIGVVLLMWRHTRPRRRRERPHLHRGWVGVALGLRSQEPLAGGMGGAERAASSRCDVEGNRAVREVGGLCTMAVDEGHEVRGKGCGRFTGWAGMRWRCEREVQSVPWWETIRAA